MISARVSFKAFSFFIACQKFPAMLFGICFLVAHDLIEKFAEQRLGGVLFAMFTRKVQNPLIVRNAVRVTSHPVTQ